MAGIVSRRKAAQSWWAQRSVTVAVFVGCCSVLLGMIGQAGAVESNPCKARFLGKNRVTLCHNASQSSYLLSEDCEEAKGFVLTSLVLAPLVFYSDCDARFHVQHLYEAQCLANQTHRQDEYDRIVFDILDKVSGHRQVNSPTLEVERFPMTVMKEGQSTEDFSAFVVFKKLCKSADPGSSMDVINLCGNQTVNGTFVYLTLRGTPLPDTPSMCQCILRPSTNLKLLALDVRLQNASNHRCGQSALKIETNSTSKEVECHKLLAYYGNQQLYINEGSEEVTLTLTYISKEERPVSIWIDAQDTYLSSEGKKMSVSCGGYIPLPTDLPDNGKDTEDKNDDDDDDDDNDGGDSRGEDTQDTSEAGTDFTILVASALGGLLILVILVIVIIIIVKRRRSGNYSGLVPSCCRCCRGDEDEDDPIFYKPVAQQEPVYAEPGKPRPSTTTPPYIFPADAKLPDSRAVYAEPDPNGTLRLHRGATPPPVPELPPPGSPPVFPAPGTPPPKPERTLLRQERRQSSKSNSGGEEVEEEYDHIIAGGKSPVKSPRGRDGQNNIIGDREEGEDLRAVGNVYDCLRHGDDYSQIGENLKQEVKDNVYDTTA